MPNIDWIKLCARVGVKCVNAIVRRTTGGAAGGAAAAGGFADSSNSATNGNASCSRLARSVRRINFSCGTDCT
jgi:hypothetical protein